MSLFKARDWWSTVAYMYAYKHIHITTYTYTYVHTYRIVLNSGPGVYFLPEVLDPALIRDRRLIETGVK